MIHYEKYFCIGGGKTGTTTLHEMAKMAGLKSLHANEWFPCKIRPNGDVKQLEEYDFFCDGGGHIIGGEHNIDYKYLDETFKNKLFILNTRDVRSWAISRCKHAGWSIDSKIMPDRTCTWRNWKEKNLLNVRNWIDYYYYHFTNCAMYLIDKRAHAIRVDVANNINVEKLRIVLGIKNKNYPWKNKSDDRQMPQRLLDTIDDQIAKHKSSQQKLTHLFKSMDKKCKIYLR